MVVGVYKRWGCTYGGGVQKVGVYIWQGAGVQMTGVMVGVYKMM